MVTIEMEEFGEFKEEKVFRITLTNEKKEHLTQDDLSAYTNLRSLIVENNPQLKTIDLRGNKSLKYVCIGTCDQLTRINLDQTVIDDLDMFDLVSINEIDLDNRQFLNLREIITQNITLQYLYIEDLILESFEKRIAATANGDEKEALTRAYASYIDAMDE